MDELIAELRTITIQLVDGLSTVTYEQLADFTEHRESIVTRMRDIEAIEPFTPAHLATIDELRAYDQAIVGKMISFKDEAAKALMKVDQGRKQKSGYEAAYTPDSYFFDRKK